MTDPFAAHFAYTYGHTVMNPLALVWMLCMAVIMLYVRREYVLIPMVAAIFLTTEMQRIVVASLNFNIMRMLTIVGWVRVLLKGEHRSLRLNRIDTLVLWLAVVSTVADTLLRGTLSAFVTRMGSSLTAVGLYFLFRVLVREFDELIPAVVALALLCVPIAGTMFIENHTGRNLFSAFGGVPEFTELREGRLRAQGPFTHSILAGTFAATLIPVLLIPIVMRSRWRFASLVGICGALCMVYFSASSGPVMSLLAGLVGLGMWYLRYNMKEVRLGLVAMLLTMQAFMKAPIWALVGRGVVVGGSTGWYRFNLLDNFIRRFGEWFLLGIKTTAYWGVGLWDVTNQYISVAMAGGLTSLILFIGTIAACFAPVGQAQRVYRGDRRNQFATWCLGASLFSHTVAFFGIAYFDQTVVSWYLLLSFLSTLNNQTKSEVIHRLSREVQMSLSP